ncbi:hypothetical protein U1Q18_030347 [Sarracenia purpurea var. burkii]
MKLTHRMIKNLCANLSMKQKLDVPQPQPPDQVLNNSSTGIRVSISDITGTGEPHGFIVSAATSLWLPLSSQAVFDFLRDVKMRPQGGRQESSRRSVDLRRTQHGSRDLLPGHRRRGWIRENDARAVGLQRRPNQELFRPPDMDARRRKFGLRKDRERNPQAAAPNVAKRMDKVGFILLLPFYFAHILLAGCVYGTNGRAKPPTNTGLFRGTKKSQRDEELGKTKSRNREVAEARRRNRRGTKTKSQREEDEIVKLQRHEDEIVESQRDEDEIAEVRTREVAGDERRTGEDDARNRQIAEGRRTGEDDALARVSAKKTTRWLGFRWDAMSNGNPSQEIADISYGDHPGNRISIIQKMEIMSSDSSNDDEEPFIEVDPSNQFGCYDEHLDTDTMQKSRSGRLGLGKQIQPRSVGDGGTVQIRGGGGSMTSPEWWPVASPDWWRRASSRSKNQKKKNDSSETVNHTARTELLNTIGNRFMAVVRVPVVAPQVVAPREIQIRRGEGGRREEDELKEINGGGPFISCENSMLVLQESSIDPLGGIVVYAPVDIKSLDMAVSGADSSTIPILPSGFIISGDGHPDVMASPSSGTTTNPRSSGSLLTVAFQILTCNAPSSKHIDMELVASLNVLVGSTVQNIKSALNYTGLD